MPVLYVTSDRPGEGKTAVCAALVAELRARGTPTAVLKAVAGRGATAPDPDVEVFERLLGETATAAPTVVSGDGPSASERDAIRTAAGEALEGRDALVVEGSSELSPEHTARVAEALEARVVVVASYEPSRGSTQVAAWRSALGERLLGVVINGLTRHRGIQARSELAASMESERVALLGMIPEDRLLLAVTVRQLSSDLGGRFVAREDLVDGLVEHILVGGLGMDSGVLYFGLRENKAVVVRGDRPDIQMAALQTPTACMVLTGGIEPIEYVRHEAELEDVPLVVVESDTLGTMAALNTIIDGVRFDHPAKLDRMVELLREHVDLAAIANGLSLAA